MTTKVTDKVTSFNTGQVIQSVYAEYTANADLTTVIPIDDTIPQITEGVEVLTSTITPKYATSIIRIRVVALCGVSVAGWLALALFQDATANSIAATANYQDTAGAGEVVSLIYLGSAASVTARTYRLRAGPGAAITLRLNGSNSSRFFGGVCRTSMIIDEIAA